MKETGIIMSGNHPKLVLDGRKTQTRRVIKPQPFMGGWNATVEHPSYGWFWKKLYQTWEGEEDFFKRLVKQCPYGQVGDRLYIKESHYKYGKWIADEGVTKTGKLKWKFKVMTTEVCYLDNPPNGVLPDTKRYTVGWFKRSPLFMFKVDARIWREITEVRVERVKSISPRDAISEGIGDYGRSTPTKQFARLWDSLNAKRGYGWEVNPWLWVLSFKRAIKGE